MIASAVALAILLPASPLISHQEAREGFVPLFDGKTMNGWKGWRSDSIATGWSIQDGAMMVTPGRGTHGDIITTERFGDFDLRLEWKVEKGGNSGVFYRCREYFKYAWYSGPEMQVLDNDNHADGKKPETSAGSCYAMYPPTKMVAKPAMEWNEARVVAVGDHIEHWLNGVKILEYTLNSPDWVARLEKAKFKPMTCYGQFPAGSIGLQDHGNRVWFRNIRIKRM